MGVPCASTSLTFAVPWHDKITPTMISSEPLRMLIDDDRKNSFFICDFTDSHTWRKGFGWLPSVIAVIRSEVVVFAGLRATGGRRARAHYLAGRAGTLVLRTMRRLCAVALASQRGGAPALRGWVGRGLRRAPCVPATSVGSAAAG